MVALGGQGTNASAGTGLLTTRLLVGSAAATGKGTLRTTVRPDGSGVAVATGRGWLLVTAGSSSTSTPAVPSTPDVEAYYYAPGAFPNGTATKLDAVTNLSFLATLRDLGQASVELLNDAATIPAIGGTISFYLKGGTPAFSMLVRNVKRVTVDQQEETGQRTTVTGPSTLGMFTQGTIGPPGGDDRFPEADTIQYNYTHPSYTQGADWAAANVLDSFGVIRAAYLFISDGTIELSPGFPTKADTASAIAPTSATLTSAPEGDWYFRGTVTFPADGHYTVYLTSDDNSSLWINGIPLVTNSGWSQTATSTEFYTAGTYEVAGTCHNFGPSPFFPTLNPTYVAVACFAGGGDFEGTTPIWTSNSSWFVNDYPADIPGMTVGDALRIMLQEHINAGRTWAANLIPTFTRTTDSSGRTWPILSNITAQVGDKCSELIGKLQTYAADINMTPDTMRWNAYVIDGLNPASGLSLQAGSQLLSLTHTEEAEVADELLTKSDALGWHIVGSGETQAFVELGSEVAASEVDTIANQLITLYGQTRESIEVAFIPISNSETPWVNAGFVPGCDLQVPDANLNPVTERVMSLGCSLGSDENLTVQIELKDHLADELERLINEIRV